MEKTAFTLVNPENRNVAFKVFTFDNTRVFTDFNRTPSYSIVLVRDGMGTLETDFSKFDFSGDTLMFFSPYQPYRITDETPLSGTFVNFHSDFLCVYKHHQEIACNGILFDNIYDAPLIKLNSAEVVDFVQLAEKFNTPELHR